MSRKSKLVVNVYQKKDTLKWVVAIISLDGNISVTFECDEKPEVMI